MGCFFGGRKRRRGGACCARPPASGPGLSEDAGKNAEPEAPGSLAKKVLIATVLGVVVYAAMSLYGDVSELRRHLSEYSWSYFLAGLGLATANYGIRFLRWQYYLARIGVESVPWGESLRIFVSGFVMSVTPGKVGEVFKSVLLEQARGVPVAQTAPIVIAERLTDLLALVLMTAVGSLAFDDGWVVALGGAALVLGIWLACLWRGFAEFCFRVAAKLPVLKRVEPKLREAYESLRLLVGPAPLAAASALSMVSWSLEWVSLIVIAAGFEGVVIGWIEGAFAYGAPTIVGAVALMPGGLGVTEAGMTSILEGLGGEGMSTSVAIAITLLVRIATLWWAVVLGVIALAWHQRYAKTRT